MIYNSKQHKILLSLFFIGLYIFVAFVSPRLHHHSNLHNEPEVVAQSENGFHFLNINKSDSDDNCLSCLVSFNTHFLWNDNQENSLFQSYFFRNIFISFELSILNTLISNSFLRGPPHV